MTSCRIKQLFVSLGLIASLLIGHLSACPCAHHVEKKAAEPDCHAHRETTKTVEVFGDNDICYTGCVCVVERPAPYVASKTHSKEFKASDKLTKPVQVLPKIEFVAITGHTRSLPQFINHLSYLSALKSLLPSRAPPRQ